MLESSPSAASAPSSDSRPPAIPPDRLCRMVTACVARDFNLDVEMLETAPRGSQRAAFARQVAMYLAHVAFGLSFEFPLILIFLQATNLVNWKSLLAAWRYSIVGIVLFAAVITPLVDWFSLALMSAPMVVFYFGAIFFGWLLFGRRDAGDDVTDADTADDRDTVVETPS